MANKGTFDGKELLSEEVWEEMHSEPTIQYESMMLGRPPCRNIFTKGGFSKYSHECMEGNHTYVEKASYQNNDGFYGW